MHRFEMIFICFFVGALLLCYGIPILGAGLHGLAHPPAVVLAELRGNLEGIAPDLAWNDLFGAIFTVERPVAR
jgi:hypothetical protein